MAVIPGHEVGRGVAARQILARDVHAAVSLRARGIDDLMVVRLQLIHGQMLANFDVAIETNMRIGGCLVKDCSHGFDLLMIGSHTGAH